MYILTPAEEFLYFEHAKLLNAGKDKRGRQKNGDVTLHDLARLIRNQGMRPEEVFALEKSHVDLEGGRVQVAQGKTKAARRVLKLTASSLEIVKARMAGSSRWLFPSPKRPGQHVVKLNNAHEKVLRNIAKALQEKNEPGFRFVLYDLRHTFPTRAAEAGIDLATLAAILGHASLRTVTWYVHPTQEHQEAAMDRLDKQAGQSQAQPRPRTSVIQAQPAVTTVNESKATTDGPKRLM